MEVGPLSLAGVYTEPLEIGSPELDRTGNPLILKQAFYNVFSHVCFMPDS